MSDSIVSYINHLRQPGVAFMSISTYNEKFNTNLSENKHLENQIRLARQQMGPNDVLVHNFVVKEEKPMETEIEQTEMDLEELLEAEYENEACETCGTEHDTSNCSEFMEEVKSFDTDEQTMKYLVAFKTSDSVTEKCLMKGKARYIKQLKGYLNGDEEATVRMFDGKKVKVASFAPNKDSLKKLFEEFPAGPHVVNCD